MTLFAVGLIGAGMAVLLIAVVALARRYGIVGSRQETRRSGRASRTRSRPAGARPGRPPELPPRPPTTPPARRLAYQETVQLHEVPAWSTPTGAPAPPRNNGPYRGGTRDRQQRRAAPDGTVNVRRAHPGAAQAANSGARYEPDAAPRQAHRGQ